MILFRFSTPFIVLVVTSALITSCKPTAEPTVATEPKSQPAPAGAPPAQSNPAQSISADSAGGTLQDKSSSLHGQIQDLHMQLDLAADALFDFDSAVLKDGSTAELQKAADAIRAKGKGAVTIIGHTDSKGDDAYNRRLSLQRANAVKDWLAANGVNQTYAVSGAGASKPIAPNTNPDGSDDPEGRAKNRRVEININSTKTLGE